MTIIVTVTVTPTLTLTLAPSVPGQKGQLVARLLRHLDVEEDVEREAQASPLRSRPDDLSGDEFDEAAEAAFHETPNRAEADRIDDPAARGATGDEAEAEDAVEAMRVRTGVRGPPRGNRPDASGNTGAARRESGDCTEASGETNAHAPKGWHLASRPEMAS